MNFHSKYAPLSNQQLKTSRNRIPLMALKLYYSPMACSLADHIALHESGRTFERERVDLKTKRTESGRDYATITSKGYVPALVFENGETLTENVAILDWLAAEHTHLGVPGPFGRSRVIEALTYISTELHQPFMPLWHSTDPDARLAASEAVTRRLTYLSEGLQSDYLFGETPSVADFYLFVMLLWATKLDLELPQNLIELRDRTMARPSVQAAMYAEGLL